MSSALAGEPLTVYEPGSQARNFVHVKDVADAFVKSAERLVEKRANGATGVEKFEIASDEDPAVMEVAHLVAELAREERGLDPEVRLVENPRGNETLVEEFRVDSAAAREQLGWEPSESVRETVRGLLRP